MRNLHVSCELFVLQFPLDEARKLIVTDGSKQIGLQRNGDLIEVARSIHCRAT